MSKRPYAFLHIEPNRPTEMIVEVGYFAPGSSPSARIRLWPVETNEGVVLVLAIEQPHGVEVRMGEGVR